jgi:hypothetical protein
MSKTRTVRISEELYERVRALAEKQKRSISKQAEALIETGLFVDTIAPQHSFSNTTPAFETNATYTASAEGRVNEDA